MTCHVTNYKETTVLCGGLDIVSGGLTFLSDFGHEDSIGTHLHDSDKVKLSTLEVGHLELKLS